jgi:hypothetical protein
LLIKLSTELVFEVNDRLIPTCVYIHRSNICTGQFEWGIHHEKS